MLCLAAAVLTLLTQLKTYTDNSVLVTFYMIYMTWYLKGEPKYVFWCFSSDSGRASRILKLIRERAVFKSGLGDSRRKKENEHKSSERSEFRWCPSHLGVPRNLASVKTDTSKEKLPQGVADLTLRLVSQTAHQTAAPNKTALWLSLCYRRKPPGRTLLSRSRACSLVPAPSLPLLGFRLFSSVSCFPAASPTPALWTDLDTWILGTSSQIQFELTLWYACLWLPLHPTSGL